jgi:hypothetical protein
MLKLKREPQDDESFEKLVVWQRAQALTTRVYRSLAEGCERVSKAEFRQFLGYAKGSAGETRSQTYTAADLGYIPLEDAAALRQELKEISRMIHGRIRSLDRGTSPS